MDVTWGISRFILDDGITTGQHRSVKYTLIILGYNNTAFFYSYKAVCIQQVP